MLKTARQVIGATLPIKAIPQLRCGRAQREDTLVTHIEHVWQANMRVYGADKVWKQMNREALSIASCLVVRLMKRLGLPPDGRVSICKPPRSVSA